MALEHKPKLIICGASNYSKIIDFKKFKEIADEVGALLLADIAHIAGLVASRNFTRHLHRIAILSQQQLINLFADLAAE